ncbi:hypothetical protein HYQ46_002152 [Verticillium longisporum]|nr:hypothetical protein HYQ46_002152 [Verticillium longisporum]
MSRPVPYLTAVATGVISAAWTSGAIAGLSIIGCPAALDFPHHLSAGVWRGLYEHGFAAMPKFAATTAAVYLSSGGGGRGKAFLGFVAAAALTVSIVPFTVALMSETNRALLLAAGDTSPQQATERIVELIGTWKALNLGRSLLPLAGAVVGALSFFNTP